MNQIVVNEPNRWRLETPGAVRSPHSIVTPLPRRSGKIEESPFAPLLGQKGRRRGVGEGAAIAPFAPSGIGMDTTFRPG